MRRFLPLIAALEAIAIAVLAWLVFFAAPVPELRETQAGRVGAGEREPAAGSRPDAPEALHEEAADARRRADPESETDAAVLRVVHGRVLDPLGAPVPACSIELRLGEDGPRKIAESTVTGAYAIAGLSPGEWQVTLRKNAFAETEQQLSIGAADAVLERDFVIRRAFRVAIEIVAPDGRTWAQLQRDGEFGSSIEATVLATRDRPAGHFVLTPMLRPQFIGIGHYYPRDGHGAPEVLSRMPIEVAGLLELEEDPPVWLSLVMGGHVLETRLLPRGGQMVRFELAPDRVRAQLARLRVRFVAREGGRPIAGLRASLGDRQGRGQQQLSDEDGVVHFVGCRPGILCLETRELREYERYRRFVTLAAGQELDLGEIRLDTDQTLRGRILDADGAPCAATIWLVAADDMHELNSQNLNFSSASKADGSFERTRVGRRRYVLHARMGKDQRGYRLLDLTQGIPDSVELRLARLREVRVEVPWLTEHWLHGKIVDGAGIPVLSLMLRADWRPQAALADGSYRLLLHDGRRVLREAPFVVAGGPMTVRVPQ